MTHIQYSLVLTNFIQCLDRLFFLLKDYDLSVVFPLLETKFYHSQLSILVILGNERIRGKQLHADNTGIDDTQKLNRINFSLPNCLNAHNRLTQNANDK